MDDRMKRIEDKLDQLLEKQAGQSVEIVEIKVDLREHMRRTQATEDATAALKLLVDQNKETLEAGFEEKIEPLEKFVDRTKFLGIVAGVLGALVLGLHELGLLDFIFKLNNLQ